MLHIVKSLRNKSEFTGNDESVFRAERIGVIPIRVGICQTKLIERRPFGTNSSPKISGLI